MATLFFRLFMAPSGAAAEKLENHLSSLSFIIIITVVIVWWPKACAFIRYFVSFYFVEFSLEIKGRVSRWSHKVALFNGQTISATRCHFIKQKRIKFIQNWHVQSGAVSFVSGRVRLQMTMLSDCWLLHPIKKSVDRWSSVDLLGQKPPPSVFVSPPRTRPFSFIFPAPTRLNFAKWTKWRRISFIRNGRCCGSTFCAEISIGCLDWYIFDTDGSNRFRWLPTNRIKMFKRTFLPARPSLAIVIRHLPKVAE